MSMIVGYAGTSTVEQDAGLKAQLRDVKAAGAKKIYSEQVSSIATRDKLEAALDYIRDGDVFVVTKLDRLARSMADDVGYRFVSGLRPRSVSRGYSG